MKENGRDFRKVCKSPYSQEQMFALVADVESYPEFVPLCVALSILERSSGVGEEEVLICEMVVGEGVLRESFVSKVCLCSAENSIQVSHISGPFHTLENLWKFRPCEGGGCEIDFSIAYSFRSFAFQLLMGTIFDRIFERFVSAFEIRADCLYGDIHCEQDLPEKSEVLG